MGYEKTPPIAGTVYIKGFPMEAILIFRTVAVRVGPSDGDPGVPARDSKRHPL